jgi:hypothetical protein
VRSRPRPASRRPPCTATSQTPNPRRRRRNSGREAPPLTTEDHSGALSVAGRRGSYRKDVEQRRVSCACCACWGSASGWKDALCHGGPGAGVVTGPPGSGRSTLARTIGGDGRPPRTVRGTRRLLRRDSGTAGSSAKARRAGPGGPFATRTSTDQCRGRQGPAAHLVADGGRRVSTGRARRRPRRW